MKTLRQQVIHLASERPDLRCHLLPLLKQASPTCDILIRDDFPGFLDAIEGALKREIPHTGSWRCWKAKEVPNSWRRPVMTIDCQLSYPNQVPIEAEVKVYVEVVGAFANMLLTLQIQGSLFESSSWDLTRWSFNDLMKHIVPEVIPSDYRKLEGMFADTHYLEDDY